MARPKRRHKLNPDGKPKAKTLSEMDEPTLRKYFSALAEMIQSVLPVGDLFALVVFENNMETQYVSNAQRKEVIKALRECANRLELRTTNERTPHE
jgi:23S rRNA U2552 (ribose-2'-O)-methylase RlmE/FtsJ